MLRFSMVSVFSLALALGALAVDFRLNDGRQIRELTLKPGLIAVYQDPGRRAVSTLVADNAVRHAIRGWQVVPVAGRSRTEIEAQVRRFASRSDVDFAAPIFRDDFGGDLIPTRDVFTGFRAGTAAESARLTLVQFGIGPVTDERFGGMLNVYRQRARTKNGFELLAMVNRQAADSKVDFVEPDFIFSGRGQQVLPDDPFFNLSWGLWNTGQFSGHIAGFDLRGPLAWLRSTGDGQRVLIIDTGVQQDHPDIRQDPGRDFTSDGNALQGGPVNAFDNHGTPVAGCVSMPWFNNWGSVGMAPFARSVSARTFISVNSGGGWTSQTSWTVNALEFARTNNIRVTNNSNGYGFTSQLIANAYQSTRDSGLVHVASAGNDGSTIVGYPARLPTVLAVAALGGNGIITSWSTRGVGLDYIAPGQDIVSTDRTGGAGWTSGDFTYATGTSFAGPLTAGVIALMLADNPTLTPNQVESILQSTSRDLGATGYDTTYGFGLPQAHEAVFACTILDQVAISPDADEGGATREGTVTLRRPAGAGGVTLTLSKVDPDNLVTLPNSVFVPAGASTATFPVGTRATLATRFVTVAATAPDGARRESEIAVIEGPVPIPVASLNYRRGSLVSGTLASLLAVDGDRLASRPGFTLNASEAPVQINLFGTLPPGPGTPDRIMFEGNISANTAGLTLRVVALRVTTGERVTITTRAITTTPGTFQASFPGPASNWISPATGQVEVRLEVLRSGFVTTTNWQPRLDMARWIVES